MKLHSAVPGWVSWIVSTLLAIGLVITLLQHQRYVAQFPLILAWILLAVVWAFTLFYTNLAGLSLRTALRFVGYGILATFIAFAAQSLVNGWLVRSFGMGNLFLVLLLTFVGACLQTLAKAAGVWLAMRSIPISSPNPLPLLAAGFGIGMGFGIAEALLLALQMLWTHAPLTGMLGIVERGAAIWFHLCSGGLIALALLRRTFLPFACVVLLHTGMDAFSIHYGTRLTPWLVQSLFWGFAALLWAGWMYGKKRMLLGSAFSRKEV